MSEPQLGVRQRGGPGGAAKIPKPPTAQPGLGSGIDDEKLEKIVAQKQAGVGPYQKKSQLGYSLSLLLVTLGAFATRFWKINHPDQVVFDEVHFGKVRINLFKLNSACQTRVLQLTNNLSNQFASYV